MRVAAYGWPLTKQDVLNENSRYQSEESDRVAKLIDQLVTNNLNIGKPSEAYNYDLPDDMLYGERKDSDNDFIQVSRFISSTSNSTETMIFVVIPQLASKIAVTYENGSPSLFKDYLLPGITETPSELAVNLLKSKGLSSNMLRQVFTTVSMSLRTIVFSCSANDYPNSMLAHLSFLISDSSPLSTEDIELLRQYVKETKQTTVEIQRKTAPVFEANSESLNYNFKVYRESGLIYLEIQDKLNRILRYTGSGTSIDPAYHMLIHSKDFTMSPIQKELRSWMTVLMFEFK
jgi:hypothetical protein